MKASAFSLKQTIHVASAKKVLVDPFFFFFFFFTVKVPFVCNICSIGRPFRVFTRAGKIAEADPPDSDYVLSWEIYKNHQSPY